MRDFMGTELEVGDYVAFSATTTRNQRAALLYGEIVKFTKIRMKIRHFCPTRRCVCIVEKAPASVVKCINPNISVDDRMERDNSIFSAIVEAHFSTRPETKETKADKAAFLAWAKE